MTEASEMALRCRKHNQLEKKKETDFSSITRQYFCVNQAMYTILKILRLEECEPVNYLGLFILFPIKT